MSALMPLSEGLAAPLVLLGVLLLVGRLGGVAAERLGQPTVSGQLIAGFILGHLVSAMGAGQSLVATGVSLETLFWLLALVVVLAGFIDGFGRLPSPLRKAVTLSVLGGVAASVLSAAVITLLLPPSMVGAGSALIVAGVIAAALLVAEAPSIGRLFREERLSRTDVALLSVAQASLTALFAWLALSIMMGFSRVGQADAGATSALVVGGLLFLLALVSGRKMARLLIGWLESFSPASFLPLTGTLSLACLLGAFSEWAVGHAIAGAALVGWAAGNLGRFAERDGAALRGLVGSFAGPCLFTYIGTQVNLPQVADPLGVVMAIGLVVVVAGVARVLGAAWGAWAGRLAWADALAVGIAGNLRGGAGAVVAFVGLRSGAIGQELFLALVTLSIVSSGLAGPCLRWSIARRRRLDFSLFRQVVIVGELQGHSRREVIRELVVEMGKGSDLGDRELIIDALLEREESMPTGLPNGLAIPHTRLAGLDRPYLAIGRSPHGVDFDAPDGQPARLIFLLLSPQRDEGMQLQALAIIASAMNDRDRRARLLDAKDTNELLMHFEEVFQG